MGPAVVMGGQGILFAATVELHPGRPDGSLLAAVLDRMLAHRDPVIVFTRVPDSRVAVPKDQPVQAIIEAWEAYEPNSFGVDAEGRANTLVVLTKERAGDLQGLLTLRWGFNPALVDGFVDLLADLSVLVSSPLAVLSHQGAGPGRPGLTKRESAHMFAVRDALRPGPAFYGLFRGLAGVAHRMILGDELVAMFGEDRLEALPPELVFRHRSGRWVLTPTRDPLEWTAERWCPGEAAIIEALGPEHFFDPVTGRLPTVVPMLPKVAPYPCRTKDRDSGGWVEHNR